MTTPTPHSATSGKPNLSVVNNFVRTEKPTHKPTEPEQAKPHTLDLLKHLPDGDFKRYVGDVARMCNIYPSTSLLVALGIVSSVACRSVAVAYQDGSLLPVGEYIICGGIPGDAKSRMLKAFQRPIFEAQKEADKAWKQRKEAHEDSGTEGKFDEPRPPRIFITDSTVEALESVLAESGGYFALASAEQAVVNTLTGAAYGGKDKKNNGDLPLKGFNAEYHAGARAAKERTTYTGIVVGAITCFAQPAAIETILAKSEGSGMAERFMLAREPTQQGTRDHTRQYYPHEYSQNVYNRIVKDIAAQALTLAQDFDDLPAYRINKEDWYKIQLFRNEMEPHLIEGGKYSTATMCGIVSKVDMHIMKIATLLAILDEKPVGEVGREYVEASINIMRDMLEYILSLLIDLEVIGFNAFENSIIAYLGKQQNATRKLIRTNKCEGKPWSEIPRSSLTNKINETVDELIRKGVVVEEETFYPNGWSQGKYLRLIA
ncbi:Protein of unknown function [Thiothrix caldifontis]|uniref:DUF3987 domain-containing protein n=1 Tax=Thiothrix caldifontis TaxID=525918 RepID=A0A1H4GLW5_9GAMM|nr:DUF3987 domain-containing protein [Thiothrix caldifontis]SEB10564.1 Protein of unknown function [Thiothrix caldifontis]